MKQQYHVIYLGCSGFPYGMAEIQKIILISHSLIKEGHSVNVISNWAMHREDHHPGMKVHGNFEGIDYTYTCGSPYAKPGSLSRKWQHLKGVVNEFFYFVKLRREKKLDFAILSTHKIRTIAYYVLLSKLLGFRTILNYVEFFSKVKGRNAGMFMLINDYLFDRWAARMVDANLPISEFLIDHLHKVAPKRKYLKVPVLTDFSKYDGIVPDRESRYFLYCGAASYIKVAKFIVDAYSLLDDPKLMLHLVVSGQKKFMDELRDHIAQSRYPDKISVMSFLPEDLLYRQYAGASALLIPLRPIIQDIARFPHKIGEYLASGNPVISTNFGEAKFYFKHLENMLLADRYDEHDFAEQMKYVIDHPDESEKIGENGYRFCKQHFDYLLYGPKIENLMRELN